MRITGNKGTKSGVSTNEENGNDKNKEMSENVGVEGCKISGRKLAGTPGRAANGNLSRV